MPAAITVDLIQNAGSNKKLIMKKIRLLLSAILVATAISWNFAPADHPFSVSGDLYALQGGIYYKLVSLGNFVSFTTTQPSGAQQITISDIYSNSCKLYLLSGSTYQPLYVAPLWGW